MIDFVTGVAAELLRTHVLRDLGVCEKVWGQDGTTMAHERVEEIEKACK